MLWFSKWQCWNIPKLKFDIKKSNAPKPKTTKTFNICLYYETEQLTYNLIVSAALSGVETLKHPLFHGICFSDKVSSFFNLVSDLFSKWNFSQKWVLVIGIKVLFYLYLWHKTIKTTFSSWKFNTITNF